MRSFLSRHRFVSLSVAISLASALLLVWVNHGPPTGAVRRDASVLGTLRGGLQMLEARAFDLHLRLRGPRPADPAVVVAAIDERSVQRYGRWPWPRALTGRAIQALHDAGAASIGLDITFTDEDQAGSAQAFRDALAALDRDLALAPPDAKAALAGYRAELLRRGAESGDDALGAALALPGVIQGVVTYPIATPAFVAREPAWASCLSPHLLTQLPGSVPGAFFEVDWARDLLGLPQRSAQAPIARFCGPSDALASFSVLYDLDGTLRRMPLFAQLSHPRGLLPSLALATAANYFQARIVPEWDPIARRVRAARLVRGEAPVREIPLEATEPFTLLDTPGRAAAFQTISVGDLLDGKVPRGALAHKAVLMGVTLLGDFDQVETPFGGTPEAGIYSQAALLSNIVSGRFLVRPAGATLLEILFLLASGAFLGVFVPRVRFLFKAIAILLLAAVWLGVSHLTFLHGVQLRLVFPVLNLFAVGFGVVFLGYLTVDREKGKLRGAFEHYLSPKVMEQMLADPSRLALGGEKKELTVLFSDVRGFTSLSEGMPPEALVKFINGYLTPMTRIVLDEEGTLDKYIGDALMAFWGAPLEQPDHPLRACRSALRFLMKMDELKASWRAAGLPEVDIGVGINSGPMVVGNMGSDVRFDYTVMGDAVNLASRLEGLNKVYGTRILVAEQTWEQVKGQLAGRRLGAVRVKGKRQPVRIYELRHEGAAFGPEARTIARFEAAVDAYCAQKFDEAAAGFREVLEAWPNDGPSWTYLSEIAVLKEQPPGPGWDGVYGASSK